MAWLKRETPYERRIRELEEEADRVRKSMQQLMRQVPAGSSHAASDVTSPRKTLAGARPTFRSTAAPSRLDEERAARAEAEAAAVETPLDEETTSPAVEPRKQAQPVAPHRPDRMAHYLSSGSFGKGYSDARMRRIQRNKAIMMFVFALLALYSLYMWLK